MPDLARCLRRLVVSAEAESDDDLLGRFAATRDEQAFAELVRRHGPMVFAVCRRVLGHRHDAEDAFQATFLVLARRAGSLRPRSALGSWLYGVAYRTALGARRVALARKAREARAGAMRETETTADTSCSADLLEAFDRELAALPEVYRAAVVACELEGMSRRDAAIRLGVGEGTLSSRLARARSLLARRLKRSGLAVPAGLAAVIGPTAVAKSLAESTVRLGTLVAAGEAAASASVAALMEGTMKAMLLAKLKTAATALVVGCAVLMTATAGWQANAAGGADPQDREKPATPRKVTRDADKDRIAELERERDKLLKELAELRDRLTKMETAQQLAAVQAALEKQAARLAAEEQRDRAVVELRKLQDARKGQTVTIPVKPGTTAPSSALPPLPGSVPTAPDNPFRENTPRPGTIVESAPPATDNPPRPATAAPTRPPAGVPEPAPGSPPPVRASSPEPARTPYGGLGGTMPRLEPPPPAPKAVMEVKVYQVRGLAADAKEGEALAKAVKAVVEPQSWGAEAGVEYLPGGALLVVRQTEKGHEEVEMLLSILKKNVEPAGRR